MKTHQEQSVEKIKAIIAKNRNVDSRLLEIANENSLTNVSIEVLPMGSGGVGQVRKMKNGSIRVQVSYAWGKWNYAHVAVVSK